MKFKKGKIKIGRFYNSMYYLTNSDVVWWSLLWQVCKVDNGKTRLRLNKSYALSYRINHKFKI